MEPLEENEDFEALLRAPLAIVFKHSTQCSVSSRAHREVEKFLEGQPGRRIHKVRVIESRSVSDYIEKATGVRHESPQVLVLRNGEVVWHDSHFGVTAEALVTAVDGA